ncbi:MAG: MG2 domain-containing protein, partial [Candidatus Eremiobacteraeota bacterium]|nr:MG2 domain-containing protein [Candidatus Eremiobacteraeota bacterium]
MKRLAATFFFLLFFAATLETSLQAQTDRYFYYSGWGARAVLPGEPVHYTYRIWSGDNSQSSKVLFHLYRVPFAARLSWMLHGTRALHAKELARLVLLQTLERTGVRSDNAYQYDVDFGHLDVGEYLVTTESPQNNAAEVIDVGSLGSVWHAGADSLLVYSVDLKTMRHRSDVQYRLERSDGSHAGLVAFGGLSWLRGAAKGGSVLIGRAGDGSITVQQIADGSGGQESGYVQTDRPIYRPGQHIYIRSILRNGYIGGYEIPHGKIRVLVRAPDGSTVYDQACSLTPFGSVSADAQLPESAPLGNYQITAGAASAWVSVQAYKKPEYLLHAKAAKDYLVSGETATFAIDAKYFFGRPASGMNIHYRAIRRPYFWGWYNPYSFMSDRPYRESAELASGDIKTDGEGRVNIAVPTNHEDSDDTLSLQVDGRDASGRTVSTQTSITLVPAQFRIDLQPDKWYAQLGDSVAIAIAAKDYEGHARPGTALNVEVNGERWDYQTHTEHKFPARSETITTDGSGNAVFKWRPDRAGSYEIHVSGKDASGHVARATLWFWVSSSTEAWWYPNQQITLIADKETYQPGQPARILLTTPQAEADAVVMVSTDRIVSARLIHVSSKPQTLVVPAPKDASEYRITVEVPSNQGLQTGETTIKVSPPPRALRVTVAPNKKRYEPGSPATLTVRVRDINGKPVRAEVGLAVVDESLFAVREDRASSAQEQFYDSRLTWIQTAASWYRLQEKMVRSGVTADTYSVNGSAAGTPAPMAEIGMVASRAAAQPKTRSYFPDTAYWKPDVVTDDQGNATVSFPWPDSLTTWRATGVAVDMNTGVGAGKEDALVTKDFLVRLEMPRFLRRGDQ